MTIRGYGPGKFSTILDSYVYALAGEGWESESLGEAEDFGYYGMVDLGPEALERIEKIASEEGDTLTEEEMGMIEYSWGAIYSEDSQGFVDVDYINTEANIKKAWDDLEEEYEAFMEEVEEEEV